MSRTLWLVSMVVVMVTAKGLVTPAHAAVVEKDKFKGNQVATSFFGSADIVCSDDSPGTVTVNGFLSGSQSVFRTKGSTTSLSNGIFVDVFYTNTCTGDSRFLSGGIADGFTAPNRNLISAELEGSTLLQDFGDGAQFPFAVDVTVTGTGDLSSGKFQSHTRTVTTPGGTFTIVESHSANANRDGTATGTVTIAGVTITPEFSFTTLSRNASSQVVITK